MGGFGKWLGNIGVKISMALRRFMMGRYGSDKLNMTILGTGLIACLLGMLIRMPIVNLILTVVSYAMMIWALFRMLSRNTYKRYLENKKFLRLKDRLKDREHRYFDCPCCRQPVRVPRGKGKISITCPKCRKQFIKKT